MIVLAVDTAGADCSAAIVDYANDTTAVIAVRRDTLGRGHAEHLMPMLQTMIGESGLGFADIERFGVAVGPGSYTGLRVGVSAVRGFALAADRPAVGVGTLEALAETQILANVGDWTGLAVAIDARHGNVYVQVFSADGTTACAPVAIAADAAGQLPAFDAIVGSGAQLIADSMTGQDVIAPAILDTASCPDPIMIAKLAARKRPEEAPPVPLYIKPPDAAPARPPLPRRASNSAGQ